MMAFGYPVLLELEGRRAVVVGELAVEAGKVEGLLVAGAAKSQLGTSSMTLTSTPAARASAAMVSRTAGPGAAATQRTAPARSAGPW